MSKRTERDRLRSKVGAFDIVALSGTREAIEAARGLLLEGVAPSGPTDAAAH